MRSNQKLKDTIKPNRKNFTIHSYYLFFEGTIPVTILFVFYGKKIQ